MTTPAVAIDTVRVEPATRTLRNSSGSPIVQVFPVWKEWFRDFRPSSASVPFLDKRFRSCQPWTHDGRRFVRDSNTVTSVAINLASKAWGSVEFENGSAWAVTPIDLPAGFSKSLENAALIKALDKLKDQKIHLGNFIAEFHKTVQMVGNAAAQIGKQVKWFRHSSPEAWKQVTRWQNGSCQKSDWKKIPNSWLQLQYGWIPLMTDISGALDELARPDRGNIPINVKASSKGYDGIVRSISSNDGWSAKQTLTIEEKVFVSLWYKLNSPVLASLSSLGLINPAEIIWEITRYSFVVDWFLPVGAWLSALTADTGHSFITGSVSRKKSAHHEFGSLRPPVQNGFSFSGMSLPSLTGKAERFQRDCYSFSPVPGLYLKSPLSAKHALNGIALLAQAFK